MITQPIKSLFKPVLLTAALSLATCGHASIVGPYTVDSSTLHLWHLDETTVPSIDAVATGGTNLVGLFNGATLGNASFTGFGSALNTVDGGQAATAGGTRDALLTPSTANPGNVTIQLANATSGAFTFEAVVQVGFDPTISYATVAAGGNGRNTAFEILSGESGVNANRIFQFRIMPIGTIAGVTTPVVTFENIRAIVGNQATIYAPIPTTGPDAIVSNNWYHVAVTYNGVPNTAGNLTFYWTLLDPSRNSCNPLTITSPTTSLSGLNPLATVTTAFMIGNEGRNRTGNFVGQIDEVRISSIARGAANMMFTPPNVTIVSQPASQLVVPGDNVTLAVSAGGSGTLGYQWSFINSNNVTNILTGATNNSLVITNIMPTQGGNYFVTITNAISTATSTLANIQVGSLFTGLFNTGVNNDGSLVALGQPDPHWQLVSSADPTFPGPTVYVESVPPPQWLPNGPSSEWLTPGDGSSIAGGVFTYQTTFYLNSQNPTNAQITGNWISDNQGLNIILNGNSTGITNGTTEASFASFTITNGFVAGLNTLQCIVSNVPSTGINPSGIRMEVRGVGANLQSEAPMVIAAPTNISTYAKQSATFTVGVVGSAPLSYQWFSGATAIMGQTNQSLTLTGLTTAQSGTYSVTVSNTFGMTNVSATLSVTAPPALAWLGLASGDWDTTTVNWLDTVGNTDTTFAMQDDVLFDDRGSGAPAVNLTEALTPNSVTVNSTANYTFSGGGSLTGPLALTKNGPGTLILDTANTYANGTTILNGIVQVGNGDASGSLGSGPVTNNASLVFNRTDTSFVPNTISGTGTLTMAGSGVTTLSGSSTYTGATTVQTGQLVVRNGTALGTGDSGTTVLDGAQLFIDFPVNLTNEPFTLGGLGLNSDGALRKGGGNASILGGPITLTDFAAIQVDASSTLTLTNPASITSADQAFGLEMLGTLNILGNVKLGAGSVAQYGTGTTTFAGLSNVWTGGTMIIGGTIQIGDGGNDGSIGEGPVTDNATLTFNSSNNFVVDVDISGSGGVNQIGAGNVTLSGNNSYSSALRVTGLGSLTPLNSAAVGGGTNVVGAAQTDTSRILLTGGLTLNNPIVIFPRAFGVLDNPANYENVSGTNTLNPPTQVAIPSGGNLFTLQSDSGDLIMNTGVISAGVGRDFVMKGAGNGEMFGPITAGTGFSVFVWKLDSGKWTLWATNTPGQTTTISNGTLVVNGSMDTNLVTVIGGTLGGTGVFFGPVMVGPGATFAPTLASGSTTPIGAVTINNSLTLQAGSTTSLQINKTAGTSDQVTGLATVTLGGTLVVNNLSGTLAVGDSFKLFNATNYAGAFTSITPATPGAGLKWNLAGIGSDGTLRVVTPSATPPTITSTSVVGGNLVFSGTGGEANGGYTLLSSTNAAAPLSTWTHVSSGSFDASGNFSLSAPISGTGGKFFALQAQ